MDNMYLYIALYAILGSLFTFFITNYYPYFFEKKLIKHSINYLEEFGLDVKNPKHSVWIKKIKKDHFTQFQQIKDKFYHLNLNNGFKIFFFILFLIVNSFLFLNKNSTTIPNTIFSNEYNVYFLHIYSLLALIIGWIDYNTRWLTNEENGILTLLGLTIISFNDFSTFTQTQHILNFVIAFLIIYLIVIPLSYKVSVGQGDWILIAVFCLYFDVHQVFNIFFIASILSLFYGLFFMYGFALYLSHKRKSRNFSYKRNLYSSKLYLKLMPLAFGQWLLLASLIVIHSLNFNNDLLLILNEEKINLLLNLFK